MNCCGNKRNAMKEQEQVHASRSSAAVRVTHKTLGQQEKETVPMQYTGDTALSVRGVFSRRIYRFAHHGALLDVDGRDAPGFLAIGVLKRASSHQK